MTWNIAVTNGTNRGQFPSMTVDLVIEGQRIQLAPGASGNLSGNQGGRMTLNAHPVNVVGVASGSADVNVLGDFSKFTCLVTTTGTALKLQVVSA